MGALRWKACGEVQQIDEDWDSQKIHRHHIYLLASAWPLKNNHLQPLEWLQVILKSVGGTVPPNSSTLRTTTFQRNAVFRPLSGKVFEMSIREMVTICWSGWATSKVAEYRHDFKNHAVLGRGWKYQIPSIPIILCVSMRIYAYCPSPPETETTSTPVAAHVNHSQRTKPPSQKFGELGGLRTGSYIKTITGWWLTYPSEKYESQLGRIIPLMENKKWSKPPTIIKNPLNMVILSK